MLGARATLLFGIGLSFGCAPAHGKRPPASGNSSEPGANRVELSHLVVTPTTADTVAEIHERGMQSLQKGALAAAAQDFDLCVRAAPKGPLAASALYHAALALDGMGRFGAAIEHLAVVVEKFPTSPFALDATLRATRLACHLERWTSARLLAEPLLKSRSSLRPFDVVLLEGAMALALLDAGDDAAAETHVARAREVIESNGLAAPGKISRDVAALYFALGEIRRTRAERIRLAPPPPNFGEVLEQRCELILSAQSAYSDAMRAYDAHWSTMAGFRIGELYASLHRELMNISPPDSAMKDETGAGSTRGESAIASSNGSTPRTPSEVSNSRRQLFEGAMRLRYSVLVEKARNMMRHTLALAARTGEQSEWVTRAQQAERELEQRLREEESALARLPFSREALEEALRKLEQPDAKKK